MRTETLKPELALVNKVIGIKLSGYSNVYTAMNEFNTVEFLN